MHGVHIAALLLERVLGLSEPGGKLIPGHLSKDIVLARTVLLDGLSGLDEHAKRLEIGGGVCIKKSKLGCSGVSVARLNPNELDHLHVLLLVEGDGDGIRSGDLEIARLDLGEVLAVRAHLDAILLDVAIGTGLARRVDNALDAHGVDRGQRQPVLTGRNVPIAVPNGGQFAVKHVLGVGAILLEIRCVGSERRRIDKVQVAAGLDLELVECGHNSGLVGVNRGLHALGQILADLGPSGLEAGNGLLGEQAVEQGSGIAVELELRIGVQAAVVGNLIGGLAILAGQQGLDLGNEAVDVGLNRVGVQEQGVSLVQELTQTGDVLLSEDGLGGDDSVVELHGGCELTGGGDADIVHIALEGVLGGAETLNREHVGGLELATGVGANRVDQLAIDPKLSLLEGVLELQLDPVVDGQRIVEGVGTVLTGDADLAGPLLDGHDLAVLRLEQNLGVVGSAHALHLDAQIIAQADGGEGIVLDGDIRLLAIKLESLTAIDLLDLGILALDKVTIHTGGIGKVIHAPLSDRAILSGRNVIPEVGVGSIAQLGNDSLGRGGINGSLAPTIRAEQAGGPVDAVVDIVLGHAVFLVVAHVVPDGEGTADHLRVTGGHGVSADAAQAVGVCGVTQVVVVVIGVRNDIEETILAVNELEAEVVHLFEVGPTGVPEIHLAVLAVLGHAAHVDGALDARKRAPHTCSLAIVLGILEHVVHKATIRVAVGRVLVSSDVNHVGAGKDSGVAALHILVENTLNKSQAVTVLRGEVQMVVVTAVGTVTQIGTDRGERQGVRRSVDLRDDVHAECGGILDEALEFGLGVPHVLGGEVGLVQAVVAALLDIGLETERVVRLEDILALVGVLLERDVVVVQVDLEVIQLEPSHLLGHLLEPIHGEGLATHVEDETADLVQRVVASGAHGERTVAGLHALQDGLTAPVCTGNGLSRHRDAIGGSGEQVALVAQTLIFFGAKREEDITRAGGAPSSGLDVHAGDNGVVGGEFLGHCLEGIGAVHHALGGGGGELTLVADPLTQLGQDARGGVGVLDRSHGSGNLDVKLLEGVLGMIILVRDLEGCLHGHIGDGVVDDLVQPDNLLIVGAVVLDLVTSGHILGQFVLELGGFGGDRLDDDVVEEVGRLLLRRGRLAVPHLELHAGGAPANHLGDLELHVAPRRHLVESDLARRIFVIAGLVDRGSPISGRRAVPAGLIIGGVDLKRRGVVLGILPHSLNMLDGLSRTKVDHKPLRIVLGGLGLGHPAILLDVLLLAVDGAGAIQVVIILACLGLHTERHVHGIGGRLVGVLPLGLLGVHLHLGTRHARITHDLGHDELHVPALDLTIELDSRHGSCISLDNLHRVTPGLGVVGHVNLKSLGAIALVFPSQLHVGDLLLGAEVNVRPLRGSGLGTPASLLGVLVPIGQFAGRLAAVCGACLHRFIEGQIDLIGVRCLSRQGDRRGAQQQ